MKLVSLNVLMSVKMKTGGEDELKCLWAVFWRPCVNWASAAARSKLSRSGKITLRENNRVSLRKAAYIPTDLRGERLHAQHFNSQLCSDVLLCDPRVRSKSCSPNKQQRKPPRLPSVRCLKDSQFIWETLSLLAGFTAAEFRLMRWLHMNNFSKQWVMQGIVVQVDISR